MRSAARVSGPKTPTTTTRTKTRNMIRSLRSTALLLPLLGVSLPAQNAQDVRAEFRFGQTFITWREVAATPSPTVYRVYRSATPIAASTDLVASELLGEVRAGSYYNVRAHRPFLLNEAGRPLKQGEGFLVTTVPTNRTSYYAVTASWHGFENQTIDTSRGGNTTASVFESAMQTRPVRQAILGNAEEFVQFLPERSNGFARAETNRPGRALNFQVIVDRTKSGPRPVVLVFHSRGGTWKTARIDALVPDNAIQIAFDDDNDPYLTSLWFGYHEGFPGPVTGKVQDYTERRIMRTLGDILADTSLQADPMRVYAYGISFGAMAALGLGTRYPDIIAASAGTVPAFGITHSDFALTSDILQLFGSQAQDLDTNLGEKIYDIFDYPAQLAARNGTGVAPMWFTCGRADGVTGWSEKPAFFRATRANEQPIRFYWDTRSHATTGSWTALEADLVREMFDVRLDRPVPVFQATQIDDDPGDGNRLVGDPIGTFGGYVTYDATTARETVAKVEFVCSLRSDATRLDNAKVSSTFADITLRRLKLFPISPTQTYHMRSFDVSSNTLVEERYFVADLSGRLSLDQVGISKQARRIEIVAAPQTGPSTHVGGSITPGGLLVLSLRSAPSQPAIVLYGTVAAQLATPWGTLGMSDPQIAWGGLTPANGYVRLATGIPPNPTLRGLKLLGQGLVGQQLTNVSSALVR